MDIADLKKASEESGAEWVGEAVHGLPGVELHVLPINDPRVQRFYGREGRKAGADMRDESGILTDAATDMLEDRAMAEVSLIGWRGLTQDGEDVPFSKDMARSLLELPAFWTATRVSVSHVTAKAARALEALAKNSKKPSSAK